MHAGCATQGTASTGRPARRGGAQGGGAESCADHRRRRCTRDGRGWVEP